MEWFWLTILFVIFKISVLVFIISVEVSNGQPLSPNPEPEVEPPFSTLLPEKTYPFRELIRQ